MISLTDRLLDAARLADAMGAIEHASLLREALRVVKQQEARIETARPAWIA